MKSLTLHLHPLSSFCQKALIAFYENDTPFESHLVNLGDAASAARFKELWPIGKFPVLRDEARGRTVPESTIIIEYLQQFYPGRTQLIPSDPDLAWQVRLRDRFYDNYVHLPMQKIVGDKLRPAGSGDPHGVAEARAQLQRSYGMIEEETRDRTWATGEAFTMADCAAAPALYYANLVQPFGATHRSVAAYFERLLARASFARAVKEGDPYRHLFPG
jgi:glutathione S-transferase